MNAALALAVGFAASWAAIYTRGLPREVREARRSEIDSDLWEHQWLAGRRREPPLATAVEMAARTLLGMLSDLTWRAEAGASARPDRNKRMNGAPYRRAGVAAGVVLVLALFLMLGTGAVTWVLAVTIPIGIAMVAIALFRTGRTGGDVGIGVDRMRARGESRWKWLLLVIGVCVATVVAMGVYAASLDEWGEARTMIFNLGGLLAVAVGLIALVLLISDLMRSARRRTDS